MSAERTKTILELLELARPLQEIMDDLSKSDPCPDAPGILTRRHVLALLRRVEQGDLSASMLTEWAREIELEDDVAYCESDGDHLADVIFEIATPEIDDRTDNDRLASWLPRLRDD